MLRPSHLSSRAVKIGFTMMALLGRIANRDKRHSSIKVVRMNQRLSSLHENYRGRMTGLPNRDANSINANIKQLNKQVSITFSLPSVVYHFFIFFSLMCSSFEMQLVMRLAFCLPDGYTKKKKAHRPSNETGANF